MADVDHVRFVCEVASVDNVHLQLGVVANSLICQVFALVNPCFLQFEPDFLHLARMIYDGVHSLFFPLQKLGARFDVLLRELITTRSDTPTVSFEQIFL